MRVLRRATPHEVILEAEGMTAMYRAFRPRGVHTVLLNALLHVPHHLVSESQHIVGLIRVCLNATLTHHEAPSLSLGPSQRCHHISGSRSHHSFHAGIIKAHRHRLPRREDHTRSFSRPTQRPIPPGG